VVDAEGLQLLVAVVDIGVAAGREVAAVYGGPAQRVTDAFVDIEIGIQKFSLFAYWSFANTSAEAS